MYDQRSLGALNPANMHGGPRMDQAMNMAAAPTERPPYLRELLESIESELHQAHITTNQITIAVSGPEPVAADGVEAPKSQRCAFEYAHRILNLARGLSQRLQSIQEAL